MLSSIIKYKKEFFILSEMVVNAVCRKCGGSYPADQFKLHYSFKMMVCPNCYTGKNDRKLEQKTIILKEPQKPAGWDKDDEYLDKFIRQKKKEVPQFRKIPGSSQVECTCQKCKYSFKYDPFRKKPHNCPYCNDPIPRLNTFSLM